MLLLAQREPIVKAIKNICIKIGEKLYFCQSEIKLTICVLTLCYIELESFKVVTFLTLSNFLAFVARRNICATQARHNST